MIAAGCLWGASVQFVLSPGAKLSRGKTILIDANPGDTAYVLSRLEHHMMKHGYSLASKSKWVEEERGGEVRPHYILRIDYVADYSSLLSSWKLERFDAVLKDNTGTELVRYGFTGNHSVQTVLDDFVERLDDAVKR